MNVANDRISHYRQVLDALDEASRNHARATGERGDRQSDRGEAIVAISKLGVPRGAVAKLTGITRGRVQQILEDAGASGAAGDGWADPELRRLVEQAIAARPIPSIGVGVRRESTLGPHLGRGYGGSLRLTGDLDRDRDDIVEVLETLAERARSGELDDFLTLTSEEHDLVRGRLLDEEE